jgi:muramoyltetrapeptide carboxypeptidase
MTSLERPVLPPRLAEGDRVAVFSPAAPAAELFPARLEQALQGLRRTLAVEPVASPFTPLGFRAGTAEERAAILREVLSSDAKAIFVAVGGFSSAEILPYLREVELAHPKIVVGYSDATSLLLGLNALAGWCTFYGPMALTQFGEYPEPNPHTVRVFREIAMTGYSEHVLEDPEEWTDEFMSWAEDEWQQRRRRYTGPAGREVWRAGSGEGRLFGGNLETLNMLIGTPYLDVPPAAVFFWEVVSQEAYLPRVRRALEQLAQAGIFDGTRAMLVGRSTDATPVDGWSLRDVVLEATREFDFPIVADLPFGHCDPVATLPIGLPCRVDCDGHSARIAIGGPATAAPS